MLYGKIYRINTKKFVEEVARR